MMPFAGEMGIAFGMSVGVAIGIVVGSIGDSLKRPPQATLISIATGFILGMLVEMILSVLLV